MNKLLIGLDVSLNSTGVCFRDMRNNTLSYLNIINRHKFTSAQKYNNDTIIELNPYLENLLKLKCVSIKMIDRTPIPAVKSVGLSQWHRLHIKSTLDLGNFIANEIYKKIIELGFNVDDVYINIENYSYSMGDQFIQLIENTYKIKSALVEHFKIKIENFYLIPGPTLKMFVGNGGFTKIDMFDKFVENSKKDNDLSNCDFKKEVENNQTLYWKSGKKKGKEIKLVLSPVDDIIDAYFLNLYLKNVFLQI